MASANTFGSSRPLSPAGSDSSTSSFKRPREEEVDNEDSSRLRRGRPKTSKPSLSTIMDCLAGISSTLAGHGDLLRDIPIMKTKLDNFCEDVAKLKIQCNELAEDNLQLRQELALLKARVDDASASDSNNAPSGTHDLARLAAATNANAAHIQQILSKQSHIEEMVISGFSFESGRTYNLLGLAASIAQALKVELQPGDLVSARIMERQRSASDTIQPNTSTLPVMSADSAVQPRSIAIKCAKANVVNRMLNAKRKHGALNLSHLDAEVIAALNLPKMKDHVIYVNELLPAHTFKLLGTARKMLRTHGFKFVWCKNGVIFAKYEEATVVHTIMTADDINKIRLLYEHETGGVVT